VRSSLGDNADHRHVDLVVGHLLHLVWGEDDRRFERPAAVNAAAGVARHGTVEDERPGARRSPTAGRADGARLRDQLALGLFKVSAWAQHLR
jgi:hypothetical protein